MSCTIHNPDATFLTNAVAANNEKFHERLRQLYPGVDDITKLPQAWSSESKANTLGLIHKNLGCYFKPIWRRDEDEKFAAAVRTDNPIPPSCLLYYFEVKIVSKGQDGFIGIGLSSASFPLNKLPGWARESYGYHADDGNIFNGDGRGKKFGPTFTTDDVIGCGYNLVLGRCFFTKNGLLLGEAFMNIPSGTLLYPTIGFKSPEEEVHANFGHESFLYDIDQDIRYLKKKITLVISEYPVDDFSKWQSTLHELVHSWLIQNSYPSTAEAFSKSTKLECKKNPQKIQQRNMIQQMVLSGRISEAIKLTNRYCPNLLQNNPNLLFALKCRLFIELISGAEKEYQNSGSDQSTNADSSTNSNGHDFSSGEDTNNQLETPSRPSRTNGCNGMIGTDSSNNIVNNNTIDSNSSGISNNSHRNSINERTGGTIDNQQMTSSSSSVQVSMDIDQPSSATSANLNESNHQNFKDGQPNQNIQPQVLQSIDLNSDSATPTTADNQQDANKSYDENEQMMATLIQLGRELNEQLEYMDSSQAEKEANEKMLRDAISLIAFIDPKNSKLSHLLNPSEREPISQRLNSSIVKAEMGESHRLLMEEIMNHLRKLVKLNNSHGRWLIDQLY